MPVGIGCDLDLQIGAGQMLAILGASQVQVRMTAYHGTMKPTKPTKAMLYNPYLRVFVTSWFRDELWLTGSPQGASKKTSSAHPADSAVYLRGR